MFTTGVIAGVIIIAALVIAALWNDYKPISCGRTALPDHDLSDLLPSATATKWHHSYACTECHSPVGHQEFMTQICLTCGKRMQWLPRSSAFRKVVRHGQWVRHQGGNQNLLELSSGKWVTPQVYDAGMRTSSAQIDEHQLESAENETGAKE